MMRLSMQCFVGFYQKSWNVVGRIVCEHVKGLWKNPSRTLDINNIDICLIPKINQPDYVRQFRPISVCNIIYKIMSKVIMERLKECIPSFVSPYQSGFVLGRRIHENIIVAQEIGHNIEKTKSKKGCFAIKVDLSKAYDKLSWELI